MLKYLIQIISLVLTISLLLFNIFLSQKINFFVPLFIVVVLLIISTVLNGYRKVDRRDWKLKIFTIFGFTFLLQSIWYLVGTKTGYTANLSYIPKGYIALSNVFLIFITLFLREVLRYILVNVRVNRKYQYVILQALSVILCVAIDLYIAPKRYIFTSFTLVYEFLALFLIPSVSKNIFLSYISNKCGYIATFFYILIMDLNIYLLPSKANLNMLVEAVVMLVFPYLLYSYLKSLDIRRNVEIKPKKKNKIISAITTVIFVIMVALVSREFRYSMIGIGSESMTGTINKGDAIIYDRYKENEDINGKVIVFRKDNRLIVHRVMRQYIVEGKAIYQTKGDHNDSMDNWVVDTSEIVGVVEYRIPLIAWPSVLLGEIF